MQEAPEVQRVARVGVRAGRREPLVLDDVPGRPRPDEQPDERDRQRPTASVSRASAGAKHQVGDAEQEPERQPQPLREDATALNPPAP